ncbi:MAG: methyltransferase domain-containing protein [Halobacteriales archaeon]|nr:methyltransferase domain-containing protein [Halobacteriales archaeon]
MTDRRELVEFDDIDAQEETDTFATYLDAVNRLADVQTQKRWTHRQLSPSAGDTLLDVGCGTGIDVRALAAEVGSDGTVIGVDNSADMIRTARGRTDDTMSGFTIGDAQRLPIETDSVDGARAERVCLHLGDPQQAVSELRRVTRPGGRIVLSETDWGTLTVDGPASMDELTKRIIDPDELPVTNVRAGRQVYRWAATAGLNDIDLETTTVALTDFGTADDVMGLSERVCSWNTADAVTDEAGRRWLETLRRADDEGVFFSSFDMFSVAGTVPD